MNKKELFTTSKNKFEHILIDIKEELDYLQNENILSMLDYKKIEIDLKISGDAVIKAIENDTYPQNIKETLIETLITQFQKSTNNTLKETLKNDLDTKLKKINKELLLKLNIFDNKLIKENNIIFQQAYKNFKQQFEKEEKVSMKKLLTNYKEYITNQISEEISINKNKLDNVIKTNKDNSPEKDNNKNIKKVFFPYDVNIKSIFSIIKKKFKK